MSFCDSIPSPVDIPFNTKSIFTKRALLHKSHGQAMINVSVCVCLYGLGYFNDPSEQGNTLTLVKSAGIKESFFILYANFFLIETETVHGDMTNTSL